MVKKKAYGKHWGLVEYKPRWGLTIQGWLVVLLAVGLISMSILFRLQPFLASSTPIKANTLVVEGWIGDEALEGAIAEFNRNQYKLLITTGIPLGRGAHLSEYKNFAALSEATLIVLGFEPQKIQPIPTPDAKRDRTLASAIAVKDWLVKHQPDIKAINVYTSDVHSRRTKLLYKQAFEPEIKVGAIAHPPLDYEAQSWWTSSQGVRTVISELIRYIYAKFF